MQVWFQKHLCSCSSSDFKFPSTEMPDLRNRNIVTLLTWWSFRVVWEDLQSVPLKGRLAGLESGFIKDWNFPGTWDGQGTLLEHFDMNICREFLVLGHFIAFVTVPAHLHFYCLLKIQSHLSQTFLFGSEQVLAKLYRMIFNEKGVLKLILSLVIKL